LTESQIFRLQDEQFAVWFKTYVSTITNSLSIMILNFIIKFSFIVHCCTWCKRFIKWEWMLALHCVYYVWVLKEKWSATTGILSTDMCFIMKNIGRVEIHITVVFVLRNRLLVSLKLTMIVELQYHSKHNRVFLFKCYWYNTIDKGIRVDPHHS
jgi:hypothetical protein